MAAKFYVFALNSVSVFYQRNQTGANEQKLPCTWNVAKLHWSPTVGGDVERGGHDAIIGKLELILFTFIRVCCLQI